MQFKNIVGMQELGDLAFTILFVAILIGLSLLTLDKFSAKMITTVDNPIVKEAANISGHSLTHIGNGCTISALVNKTNNVALASGVDYSFITKNCTIRNLTTTYNTFLLNATYTWNGDVKMKSYNATVSLTDQIATLPGWVGLIITIAVVVILLTYVSKIRGVQRNA